MKPNSDLQHLINSLSGTEKAYFRKFASRHYKQNNTFSKLFNEMEANKDNGEFSEEDVKRHFKNEKFIRQLPVTKIYLYNNILKSLNLYYTEDNTDIKLSLLLNNAMILYKKELFGQCLKMIGKAKEIAEKFDKPAKLLEGIHIERLALRINTSLNEVSGELMKNYDEEEEVLSKLKNISEYRRLYDRMVIRATAKGFSAGKERHKTFEKILASKLLKNYDYAKYFQSRVIFFLMHCFINNARRNYESAFSYGIECLDLIGDSQYNKIIAVYEYLLILQELMTAAYSLGRLDISEQYFDKLIREQDVLLRNSPNKVRNFLKIRTLTVKLNINAARGKIKDNLVVLEELFSITKQNEESSFRDEVIVTDFLAAAEYFALSMYDKSIYHINRIFNSKAFALREDIQISCRIMNLILHYELGHMGSLEYYIRSTYRYLKKQKKLNRFEKLVFEFLKKSQGVISEKEITALFAETRDKLRKAAREEPGVLQAIDLDAWLESKILHLPYIDIINKKNKKD